MGSLPHRGRAGVGAPGLRCDAVTPTPTFPRRGKEKDAYLTTTNLPSLTCSITPVSFV
jgi:hypothetical protein